MKISRMLMLPAFLVILSLVGCGGGSDGEKSITSTVSGTVNKGIIINGEVKAYKVIFGVIDSEAVATGTTDDKGKYSLNIVDYSGPLHIVVSAGTDSKMKCDTIGGCDTDGDGSTDADFGAIIDMPANLVMEAVIPNVSGGEVKGSVNPLTHLAAAYAKTFGMGDVGIQAAIDRVEALFDVDDLTVDPLDITDDSAVTSATVNDVNALKIAYISAAIAKIAGDDFDGNVASALDVLTTNFISHNGELTQNLSSQDGKPEDLNEITLLEITDASLATMESPDVADNENLDAGIGNELASQNSAASSATEGENTSTTIVVESDDLDAAKNIVQTVRTWADQLQTLDEKGELFADEYGMTQQVSELAMESAGEGFAYSTGAAAMAYAWSNHLASPVTQSIAGKSITFDKGTEDETVFTFTCDGEIIDDSLGGDYLANGNKLYLWLATDESYIATIPTNTVIVGQTWSIKWIDEYNDTSETFNSVVSEIITTDNCDFNASQLLADYVEELDSGMGSQATGTVVVTGNNVTVDGAVNGAVINMTYSMPDLVSSTFSASLGGNVSIEDKATLTVGSNSVAVISLNGTHDLLDEFTDPPSFKNANLVLDVSLEQGSMDDNNNAVADPVKFVGKFEAAAVSMPGKTWDDFDLNPSSLKLSGVFSRVTSGQSFEASFDATMSNANTFIPVAPLPVRNDLVSYSYSSDGNSLTIDTSSRTTTYSFDPNTSNITVTNTYDLGGESESIDAIDVESLASYLDSKTMELGGQNNWWIWVDCEGEYRAEWPETGFPGSSGVLPATLQWSNQCDDEDASHWRDIQGELSLKAKFDNLPEATITASVDRTGYEAASGAITFAYDDITLTLSGSGDGSTKEFDLNLLVTDTSSGSPARLTIYPDTESEELKGSVVVNGVVVGTIGEMHDGEMLIINYIDGSFESVVF